MGVKNLEKVLTNYNTICVDTMVFIYLLEQNSKYIDLAALVLGA